MGGNVSNGIEMEGLEFQLVGYTSEYVHSLDARNRVTVPAAWRVPGDEESYYFAFPDPEGCITVYPPEMQEELLKTVRAIKLSNTKGQAVLRKIFGKGFKFGCDKQGRILIPEPLLRHAGIEKRVSMVGMGRYFQIWSEEKYSEQVDAEINLHEAMGELGL